MKANAKKSEIVTTNHRDRYPIPILQPLRRKETNFCMFQRELGGNPERVAMVVSRYKFYLSIENSKCIGYITEKFFDNALLAGIVGIVAGTSRNDYEALAPKNSFIHVDDYGSIEALASKINHLLDPQNEQEYEKFFAWKKQRAFDSNIRQATLESFREDNGMCKLIQTANEIKEKVRMNNMLAIKSVHNWWYGLTGKGVNRTSTCMPNMRRKRRALDSGKILNSDLFFDDDVETPILNFL